MTVDVRESVTTLNHYTASEIRAEMGRQQLSGRKLAERMGRSPNWVSLKTSGASGLGVDDLEAVAKALGLLPDELIRRARTARAGLSEPTRS
jgi:transcriptional regulator with XRE-family HTH domain